MRITTFASASASCRICCLHYVANFQLPHHFPTGSWTRLASMVSAHRAICRVCLFEVELERSESQMSPLG